MEIEIKEIRERSGLTQKQFSQKYNIPVDTLQNWEQGRRKCPAYVITLLEIAIERKDK